HSSDGHRGRNPSYLDAYSADANAENWFGAPSLEERVGSFGASASWKYQHRSGSNVDLIGPIYISRVNRVYCRGRCGQSTTCPDGFILTDAGDDLSRAHINSRVD